MNYYEEKTNKVKNLKHFPCESIDVFQKAVEQGVIIDISIAMDIARKWVMETNKSTPFQRYSRALLSLLPFILTLFYIIAAFVLHNYWLILYSLLPIIVAFTGSPIARKIIPLHFVILGLFILIWALTGNLSMIYWVPIVAQYLALDYMYKGSTNIVRKMLLMDEDTLCYFWKWNHMSLYFNNGGIYSQNYQEVDGKTNYYEDMTKEWKDYIDKQDKK